jgi:hypothetical protein
MFEISCPFPWEVSVPSLRRIIVGLEEDNCTMKDRGREGWVVGKCE